jgi:hypothetical protein
MPRRKAWLISFMTSSRQPPMPALIQRGTMPSFPKKAA